MTKTKEITKIITFIGWLGLLFGGNVYMKYNCYGFTYILFGNQDLICRSIESFQKPFLVGNFGLIGYFGKKYTHKLINNFVEWWWCCEENKPKHNTIIINKIK